MKHIVLHFSESSEGIAVFQAKLAGYLELGALEQRRLFIYISIRRSLDRIEFFCSRERLSSLRCMPQKWSWQRSAELMPIIHSYELLERLAMKERLKDRSLVIAGVCWGVEHWSKQERQVLGYAGASTTGLCQSAEHWNKQCQGAACCAMPECRTLILMQGGVLHAFFL